MACHHATFDAAGTETINDGGSNDTADLLEAKRLLHELENDMRQTVIVVQNLVGNGHWRPNQVLDAVNVDVR